jgi:hypothetical protein
VKFVSRMVLLLALVASIGCGGGDPAADANKNLKPIDPKTPRPEKAPGVGAGGGDGEKAAGVIK